MLPEGVEKVVVRKANGKVYSYYYWNPGRGTDREGERIKLPNADTKPAAFWARSPARSNASSTRPRLLSILPDAWATLESARAIS